MVIAPKSQFQTSAEGFCEPKLTWHFEGRPRGKLVRDDESYWCVKSDAARLRNHPDVLELRVPEPLEFNGK